jgi:hypothetical protein
MKKKDAMTDLIESLPKEDGTKPSEKPEGKPQNNEEQQVRDSDGKLITLDIEAIASITKIAILKQIDSIEKKYKRNRA